MRHVTDPTRADERDRLTRNIAWLQRRLAVTAHPERAAEIERAIKRDEQQLATITNEGMHP